MSVTWATSIDILINYYKSLRGYGAFSHVRAGFGYIAQCGTVSEPQKEFRQFTDLKWGLSYNSSTFGL